MSGGSDLIRVRYFDEASSIPVQEKMTSKTSELVVKAQDVADNNFKVSDLVVVADCETADLFQITGIVDAGTGLKKIQHVVDASQTPGNRGAQLHKIYNEKLDARIFHFREYSYYIAPGANGRPSLFRAAEYSDPVELVYGIRSMQIMYGLASSGTTMNENTCASLKVSSSECRVPGRYVTAADVGTDWSHVMSVRLGLLVEAVANTATGQIGTDVDTKTYDLNRTTATIDDVGPYNDAVIRQMFFTTVKPKNIQ